MIPADLAKLPLLGGLTEAEREIAADAFEEVDVPAGVSLFREGDPADGALLVLDGRVRVHAERVGAEAVFGAGDALGTLALVAEGRREASAETLSRTRIWRLRRSAYRSLVASAPAVACRLLEGIVREHADSVRDAFRRGAAG